MSLAPAPSRGRTWLRKWRTPLFGVALGVLQVLVIWVPLLEHWSLSWWPWLALCALFYLLIPALAGFLAAAREGDTFSGVGAGCLTGAISVLVVAIPVSIPAVTLVATSIATPRLVCPPPCSHPPTDHYNLSYYALAIPSVVILLAGVSALVGGSLGGWIGGVLGQRYAGKAR